MTCIIDHKKETDAVGKDRRKTVDPLYKCLRIRLLLHLRRVMPRLEPSVRTWDSLS